MLFFVKQCVLDGKVIHHQNEEGVLCVVLLEYWCRPDQVVPKLGQMFYQGLIDDDACLFKAIDVFDNFYIHKTFF